MSENIGSAITGLTNFNVNTQIPSISENANIQEAFRLYHYGAPSGSGVGQYNPSNTNPDNLKNPSIAHSLYSLQYQISNLTLGVLPSTWTGKGALVSASASSTPVAISVGANGSVLVADSTTTSGLAWRAPEVTAVNSVTLSNKTIGTTGLAFEGSVDDNFETTINVVEPTADRTILFPDRSGNVVLSTAEFNQQLGSYTILLSDNYKILEISSTSANTVTIPTNTVAPFPIGSQITVIQTNTGQTTVSSSSGVTLNCTPQISANSGRLRSQWSSLTLIKRGTDTWIAIGDLTA